MGQGASPDLCLGDGHLRKVRTTTGTPDIAGRGSRVPPTCLGRRIINEFPNTRMASEVRDMLDNILARANATAGV